jgi:hypothetical protein
LRRGLDRQMGDLPERANQSTCGTAWVRSSGLRSLFAATSEISPLTGHAADMSKPTLLTPS